MAADPITTRAEIEVNAGEGRVSLTQPSPGSPDKRIHLDLADLEDGEEGRFRDISFCANGVEYSGRVLMTLFRDEDDNPLVT